MSACWHVVCQAKQQQLIQERRKQEEEKLLTALASPMGFHKGKPLAALVVFRACLQWRAFQADRTSVFDRIIQVREHRDGLGLGACCSGPGRRMHGRTGACRPCMFQLADDVLWFPV